jgi:hypothetical protein
LNGLIRTCNGLDPWILDTKTSLLSSFCSAIIRDRNAVHAAITELWSNGQAEGCHAGAPCANLCRNISLHARDKTAPLKPGIKHLNVTYQKKRREKL